MPDKTIQQILEEERAKSPLKDLDGASVDLKISYAQRGLMTKELHKDPQFRKKWIKLNTEAHNKRIANPEWQRKVAQNNKLKAKDPVWLEKITKANKERTKTAEWREANTRGQDHRRVAVAVKQPGKEWQHFPGANVAAKELKHPKIGQDPKSYFPIDGTVKTIKRGDKAGWQFKRIIDGQ